MKKGEYFLELGEKGYIFFIFFRIRWKRVWDLFCVNTVKLYTSWNIAFRILFGLPRQTDRYFIELISEQIHLKTMLCSRFVAFCKGIESLEQNQIFKPKYL